MHDWLPYAPLLASTIAVCAMLSGLWQFRTTQRLTREAKAVDLFIKFNELNEKLPRRQDDTLESPAFWQFNALLAITKSVARLTDGDASWAATVVWMLEQQQWFLARQPIRCKSFSPTFVAQMKQAVPTMTCEDD